MCLGMRLVHPHCHVVCGDALCSYKQYMNVRAGFQSRSLCRERVRSQHTHFGQWKSELQQFLLLKYTEIPASRVCMACDRLRPLKLSYRHCSYPVDVINPRCAGLLYLVCVSVYVRVCVCVCVCVWTTILALQATRGQLSDTNSVSATRA